MQTGGSNTSVRRSPLRGRSDDPPNSHRRTVRRALSTIVSRLGQLNPSTPLPEEHTGRSAVIFAETKRALGGRATDAGVSQSAPDSTIAPVSAKLRGAEPSSILLHMSRRMRSLAAVGARDHPRRAPSREKLALLAQGGQRAQKHGESSPEGVRRGSGGQAVEAIGASTRQRAAVLALHQSEPPLTRRAARSTSLHGPERMLPQRASIVRENPR